MSGSIYGGLTLLVGCLGANRRPRPRPLQKVNDNETIREAKRGEKTAKGEQVVEDVKAGQDNAINGISDHMTSFFQI